MATTINADTSSGLKITSDTSGVIEFQSAGATKAGVNSTGLTGDGSQLTGLATGDPSAVKQSFNLAASGSPSVTAGRGVSVGSDGTVGILPTSNTIGSTLTGTDYAGSISSTEGYTSDGSKWIKAVASGSQASRILTLTGYSMNTSGVITTGSTTVTVESPSFMTPVGVVWIITYYDPVAIDNDKILLLSGGGSVGNGSNGSGGTEGEFEAKYRLNIISIADNGNLTKTSDYISAHQTARTSSWPTYVSSGISKISDTQYHVAIGNNWGYAQMSKIVTISGTSFVSNADNGAPGAAADLMLNSRNSSRAGTWYNMMQIESNADTGCNPSYHTTGGKVVAGRYDYPTVQIATLSGNAMGTATTSTVISDAAANNTIRWGVLANGLWIARYKLEVTNEIVYRTFLINESTGALTSVHFYNTNTLETPNNPYDLETFRAERAGLSPALQTVVGVGIYDIGGVQSNIINSMSVSATGEILGFNTGGSNLFVSSSDRELVNYTDSVWWYSYRKANVTYMQKYTVNAASTPEYNHVGFATATSSSGAQLITVAGVATGFSGLTIGKLYYTTSDFTGQVTTSSLSGNLVGKAISATEILLNRES